MRRRASASTSAARRPTGCSRSKRSSVSAACTVAPAVQVNYRYEGSVTTADPSTSWSTTSAPARDDMPVHGTLATVRQTPTDRWADSGRQEIHSLMALRPKSRRSSARGGTRPTPTRSTATCEHGGYEGCARRSPCRRRSRRRRQRRHGAGPRRRRLPGRQQVEAAQADSFPRWIVVNGDESEPGTHKDRTLMERDPHMVIEGALIAAYACKASQVFLYVRGEMAFAQERIATALNEAYAAGYVGKNILGSDWSVDITLHWGAGAYIVGDETALLEIARGQARDAAAEAAVLPRGHGPVHEPDDREQRRDAGEPPVDHGQRRRGVRGDRQREVQRHAAHRACPATSRSPAPTRSSAASSPSASVFYDPSLGGGIRDDNDAEGVHPRRRFVAVVVPRAPRHAARSDAGRARRIDARLGCDRRHGRDDRHGQARAGGSCSFYAKESCGKCTPCREGTELARDDPRPHPRRSRSPRGSRPVASTCPTTSAPGHSPGRTLSRRAGVRAVPVQEDDDLRPRSVGGVAADERAAPLPSASSRPTSPSARASRSSPVPEDDSHARGNVRRETTPTERDRRGHREGHGRCGSRRRRAARAEPAAGRPRHPRRQGRSTPTRASCSSPPRSATACTSRASATTSGCVRSACAACASSRSTAAAAPMLSPACLVECSAGHEGRDRSRRRRRRRRTASSSSCSSTTRSTARCATRAASARCRTTRSRSARRSRAWSRRSVIARSRSRCRDLVLLDRERCILCDRCTRFADEVAGDPLIKFIQRGVETEVNTFPTDPFASYFSGNTVQLCPVGALTAKPYRFAARPWDLDSAESTCTTCAVGCRIAVQSQGRELTRYLGVDSEPVNHGWLCDKGRFAYEAINNAERASRRRWCARTANSSRSAGARRSPPRPRASRTRVGRHGGVGRRHHRRRPAHERRRVRLGEARQRRAQDAERRLPTRRRPAGRRSCSDLPAATIDEACTAPVVITLAPDLKQELPVLFLRLRDALVEGTTKLDRDHAGVDVADAVRHGEPRIARARRRRSRERWSTVRRCGCRINPAAAIDAARAALAEPGAVVILGRPSTAEAAELRHRGRASARREAARA